VPLEFLDRMALLGPQSRIAERMREFAAAGVTTLTLSPAASTLAERQQALDVAAAAWRAAGYAA
jgi:hypothetical protein